MGEALVSIVVPTYNRAYCVCETIDSVLAQSHRNTEVLVVDDGSSDNTRVMIGEKYGGEPRVKYHHKKNGGVASARNLGITLAKGDFLALLDSDDIWEPWKLELQLACMRQRPEIGMIWSDMAAVGPNGREIAPTFLRTMYHAWRHFSSEELFREKGVALKDLAEKSGGPLGSQIGRGGLPGNARFYAGSIFSEMILGSLVHTSTVLLRRERLEKVRCFNVEYTPIGEDYDFHLRTCKEGPVGFLDLPTIRYKTGNPDQLTRPELLSIVAKNCLRTIMPLIESGEGITLSRKKIRRRISDVHAWVADTLLQNEDIAGCRRHTLKSLRYCPWHARRWKIFLGTCLPAPIVRKLRNKKPGTAGAAQLNECK